MIDKDDEFGGFEAEFGTSAPAVTLGAPPEAPVEKPEAPEEEEPDQKVPAAEEAPDGPSEPSVEVGATDDSPPLEEHTTPASLPGQKKVRKPLTKRQKLVRVILRRAGLEALPELSHLMRDKEGVEVPIKDIALFIGEPDNDALAEISEKLQFRNTVNLSAEVERNRVVSVGTDILKAGRMFQPIQLADIQEGDSSTGVLQCTSGRHRLAFLALAYGVEAAIPVYVENMTLNEARDAVVVANQARPTRARERAEHAVLGAVGGNADAHQEELYNATATTKTNARKYCVYSVFDKGHPLKLDFQVSQTSSRKDGGLTTVSNVENFWNASLAWDKDTSWKKYDGDLKLSIQFLNELVDEMNKIDGFEPSHHLASMTLSAIGKWYRAYREITGEDASPKAAKVAGIIVSLGEIGRQKSESTYDVLTVEMRS